MVFIASSGVLSSSAISFNFTDIPQTFTHLQVRVYGRTTTSGTIQNSLVQFNDDIFASNYTSHNLFGNGASASSSNPDLASTFMTLPIMAGSTATSNVFSNAIIDVLDYASTNKTKVIRYVAGVDNNGSGQVTFGSGVWFKTPLAAVTKMGFYSNNIAAGSRFDLYGITSSQVTGA
jgi:hypothetical protein